jgi:FlaA1/EpsC-like NDP-sugar epimerase
MARISGQADVKSFVLVSTDKAVAPATVMGASKALAEFAIEAEQARFPRTRFCAVRFGNVLGSSGSVVPIFRRQIANGGPVTVTDEGMTRFFMTIPEAVQLVIRSGSLTRGGEVYVLEMGEPVRIMDLAEDMIRFSGLEPGRDIAIEVVGRRPGEKLEEILFNRYEQGETTPAQKILRAVRPTADPDWVEDTFDRIEALVARGDARALAATVSELSSRRAAASLAPQPVTIVDAGEVLPDAPGGTATAPGRAAS